MLFHNVLLVLHHKSNIMKFRISSNRIVNIAVISFAVIIVVYFFALFSMRSIHFTDTASASSSTRIKDNLPPIDPEISQQLPYNEYVNKNRNTILLRDLKNGDGPVSSSTFIFLNVIATHTGLHCDTCTKPFSDRFDGKDPGIPQYYIKLLGWKLKQGEYPIPSDSVYFHMKNGQEYLRKQVITKTVKNGSNHTYFEKELRDEPVKFRYNRSENCMMIPVSASAKKISNMVIGVFTFSLVVYFLYAMAEFIKLIIDISKAQPFTDQNIRRLRLLAFSFLGFPILTFTLNLIMRLVFNRYFTNDLVMKETMWESSWIPLGIGIVFFLLFRAFKKGKMLTDEVALTV